MRRIEQEEREKAFNTRDLCRCGRPKIEGFQQCQVCKDKSAQYRSNKKEAERTRIKNNKDKGLCHCGRARDEGFKTCSTCRTRAQTRSDSKRERAIENDLCATCGNPREQANRRACNRCLKRFQDKAKEQREKDRAAGICLSGGCKKPLKDGHTLCDEHLEYMRRKTAARNQRRKEAGVCRDCTGPLPFGRTALCLTCFPTISGKTLAEEAREREAKAAEKKEIERRERAERNARCIPALQYVSDKHKRILELRWGLDRDEDRTLQEVGDMFGMSRERVRQIEARALKLLEMNAEDRARCMIPAKQGRPMKKERPE